MDNDSIVDNLLSGIFFPRKTGEPMEEKTRFRVLKIKVTTDITIGGILYLNENPIDCPTVIFFHGNGETAMDYNYFAKNYLDCGMNLAVFDYRGYGFSTGTPKYSAMFKDPIIIYDQFDEWIEKEYSGTMAETFFVMGRSLGSASAAALGAYNPQKMHGIIFESGFGSGKLMVDLVTSRHPDIDLETLKPYSNDTYLVQIKKPALVIHGEMDNIVPFASGKYLYDSIPESVEKEFIGIQSATHNDISMYEEFYFPPIRKFLEKYR